MQQRNQYPATRTTESVAESDSTSSRVHVVDTKAKNLCICFDDSGESFVELPDGDVRFGESRLFQELFYY
jgi:hypothetical protein